MASDARADTAASAIAGRGSFAGCTLPAGTLVARLDADVCGVGDLGTLNHSCDPNLGWTSARTLVARRDIATGEELTVDYATCVSNPGFVMFCHCETYRCRQVIEGTDWQIPQLQHRYVGWWTPTLQALIDTGVRQPG